MINWSVAGAAHELSSWTDVYNSVNSLWTMLVPRRIYEPGMKLMAKVIELVQDARASAHESLNKNLFSGRFSRQERNRAEAFDVVISELLRKKKEGK